MMMYLNKNGSKCDGSECNWLKELLSTTTLHEDDLAIKSKLQDAYSM